MTHILNVSNNSLKKTFYISILLNSILIFSCGQNSAERKLNGKWYETENEKIFWLFYPDSLVFIDEDNQRVKWTATQSTVEFSYPTFYWDSLGKPVDVLDKILVEYELSENEDTLFGTLKNRNGKYKFGLIRAE